MQEARPFIEMARRVKDRWQRSNPHPINPREHQYDWEKDFVPTPSQGLDSVFYLRPTRFYRLHLHDRNEAGEIVETGIEDFRILKPINMVSNLRFRNDCVIDVVKPNPNKIEGEDPYLYAHYDLSDLGYRVFIGTWRHLRKGLPGGHYNLPMVEFSDPRRANWVEDV